MKSYESNGNLSNILDISYRENGEIIHNPDRPYERNIDKFVIDEMVFNDVISLHGNYSPFVTLRNYKKENINALAIHIGRGCPGKCVYCLKHKEQYRTRSVDSIIEEIKKKIKEYDCHAFHLQDPHLLKRTGFVKEFCNRLIDEKIWIKWWAETRADIKLELIDLMSKAGCVSLDFGLESASDRVQTSIKKKINVRQVEQLIKKCAHVGIRIKVFSMISLPDEREEDALKTLKFLKSFKPYIQHFTAALTKIYPGSDLEIMAKERGILKEDFSWYDRNFQNDLPQFATSCVPIWMEHLSPEFIIDYKEQIRFIRFSRFKAIAKKIYSFIFEYSFKRKWNGIRPFYSLLRHKSKIMQMRKTGE